MQRSHTHRCQWRRVACEIGELAKEQGDTILMLRDQLGVQQAMLHDALDALDVHRKLVADQKQIIAAQAIDKEALKARLTMAERKQDEQAQTIESQAAELAAKRAEIEEVRGKLAAASAALEALERRVLGPKSERMPTVGDELRDRETEAEAEERRLKALERRRRNAALRDQLRKETVIHHVSDEDRPCPTCGGEADRPLGEGKRTTIYEYVPGYFVKQEHVQEKLACRCGVSVRDGPP